MIRAPYVPVANSILQANWVDRFERYDDPVGAFDELLGIYRTPGRYYHTIEHGLEVAQTLVAISDGLPRSDVDDLCLAAWAHDAYFTPGNTDNEERSALLAERLASRLGFGAERGRRVRALVQASSHTVPPSNDYEQMICDADLAVLAKPWYRYLADVQNIRGELAVAGDDDWREVRLKMLSFFDDKQPLYHLPVASGRWEEAAFRNLRRERRTLVANRS